MDADARMASLIAISENPLNLRYPRSTLLAGELCLLRAATDASVAQLER